MRNYNYYVNEKKHTVICVLHTDLGEFRGISKCDLIDTFDVEFGKELARKRAVLKHNEYELSKLKWQWDESDIRWFRERERDLNKNLARREALKNGIEKIKEEIKNSL